MNDDSGAGKGTVEYEDVILFVTDIRFGGGGILVTATGRGPAPEYHGPARIYGPDGLLVIAGGWVDVPAARSGQFVTLETTVTPSDPEASAPDESGPSLLLTRNRTHNCRGIRG